MRVIQLDPDYNHGDHVRGLLYRPDGGALAAAVGEQAAARTVSVWDLAADRGVYHQFLSGGLGALDQYAGPAVRPDLLVVADHGFDEAAGAHTIGLTVLGHGDAVATVGGDDEEFQVLCLGFTPDGETLLAGVRRADGPQIARWDVPTLLGGGAQVATVAEDAPLDLDGHRPACLACSPSGRLLAVGIGAGGVLLVDPAGGGVVRVLRRRGGGGGKQKTPRVSGLAFHPDGRRLAARAGGEVTVWDAGPGATGRPLAELSGADRLTDVTFSPDGRTLVAAGRDGTVTVWDADTFAERRRYAWGLGGLSAVAFAPDGLTAAAGADRGQVVVWDVED